jgi:hypothetical protein
MKPLIFFFIVGLSAFTCYTQDTLVDSKGLIFPARITAVDSNFITYASPDTLFKEQIIIPRSTIIFIKYENGKTEQLYVSDTLITKEGLFITCKVLEIDASTLTYFTFRDKFTSPSVMMKSNLLLIKLHDGTNEIADQLSGMSDTDYQNLGASDAKLYYKVKPEVIVSEIIMGAGTIFVAPILAGTLIAYVKPTKLENGINPNNDLLISNPHYKKGYQNKAAKKKIYAATLSYFGGIVGFIGGVIIAFQFW